MTEKSFIHAPALFAFRGITLTLGVLVPDDSAALLPIEADFSCEGSPLHHRVRMFPTDGYRADTQSYSVYTAALPGDALTGGQVRYFFLQGRRQSRVYCVPLLERPEMPPLTISENGAFLPGEAGFLELCNHLDRTLDLYDFELLLVKEGERLGRNPLSDRPGENLIPPGRAALLRFRSPALCSFARQSGSLLSRSSFLLALSACFPAPLPEEEDALLFYEADLTGGTGETLLPGTFELCRGYTPHTLMIVPRGGGPESAVFTASTEEIAGQRRFARQGYTALFTPDASHPETGRFSGLSEPCLHFSLHGVKDEDGFLPLILPLGGERGQYRAGARPALSFAAIGETLRFPTVLLKEDGKDIPHPATLMPDGCYRFSLPPETVDRVERLEACFEVTGSLYTARYGSSKEPFCVPLLDNAGPEVLSVYPAREQVLEKEYTPRIEIAYHDISGVNLALSVLCLDGRNVSGNAQFLPDRVIYIPETPLSEGVHTVELTLRDMPGNRTYLHYYFTVCESAAKQLFRGQLSCHTDLSDGVCPPGQALSAIRETGAHFAVLCDPLSFLTEEDYGECQRIARKATLSRQFAVLSGYETVLECGSRVAVLSAAHLPCSHRHPALSDCLKGENTAVAAFFPGDAITLPPPELLGREAARVALCAMNGPGDETFYTGLLSAGYRVGPVADTHGSGFALCGGLTPENLLGAFMRRRTYYSDDPGLTLFYHMNGVPMGGILHAPVRLEATVEVETARSCGLGVLELRTAEGITVARADAGALRRFCWQVELPPDFSAYYVRLEGAGGYAVSAPVFVTGREALSLSMRGYGIAEEERCHALRLLVKNGGERPVSELSVDFYLSPGSFAFREAAPYQSARIARLSPGEEKEVVAHLPDLPGVRRVHALAAGTRGKEPVRSLCTLSLIPLYVSCFSPDISEENGVSFPYLTLYNPLPESLPLSRFSLCFEDGETAWQTKLPELKLPPESPLVIWLKREGETCEAGDFNTRYGTELLEGENLIPLSGFSCQGCRECRISLFENGKEISVADGRGAARGAGGEILFLPPDKNGLQKPLDAANLSLPQPGRLLKAQVPPEYAGQGEEEKKEEQAARKGFFTRISDASLAPLRAAALMAGAVSAFKGILKE